MGCVGYNLRARMALAVLVGHAIVKHLSGAIMGQDSFIPVATNARSRSDLVERGFSRQPLRVDVDIARSLEALSHAAWSVPKDKYYDGGDRSPPGLHKDGEKYIATHLVGRCGAQGGEVVITDNDKQEMDRFTMRESGECYVFDDDRIWHMLTPVAVLEGNQYAYRDTLAFDMLPEGWEPVK